MQTAPATTRTRSRAAADPVARLLARFPRQRSSLIPILQRLQARLGFLSEDAVVATAAHLRISENEVYGVASFYSQFRFSPPGRHSVKVCLGTACHVRGGQILIDAVARELAIRAGETTTDRRFDLQRVACLGCCALAPVVQVGEDIHSRMNVTRLRAVLDRYE